MTTIEMKCVEATGTKHRLRTVAGKATFNHETTAGTYVLGRAYTVKVSAVSVEEEPVPLPDPQPVE